MTPRVATWRPLVSGAVLLLASVAGAQEEPVPTVHWAYASYFGTGWYKISDQQRAFIANFAPPMTKGETRWFGGKDGKAVYSIRGPLTVGLKRCDFVEGPGSLYP